MLRIEWFALALVALSSACADSSGVPAGVSIDTLANGAVHVRNGSEGLWATRGREPWTLVEDLRRTTDALGVSYAVRVRIEK